MTTLPRRPARPPRHLGARVLHRVVYTLLFTLLALAIVVLVAPTLRQYSGTHETIIGQAVVLVLLVELAGTRLHRLVDWLLYGQRHDPATASARLSRPLADAEDADVLEALLNALTDTLRLSYAEVMDAHGSALGVAGADPSSVTATFPIRRAGRDLGVLQAGRRGTPLDRRDERLLEAAAAQVGLVLHAQALTEDLREAREDLVASAADERRRLRREIHDGVGPTLAGIGLGVESAARAVDRDPPRARRLLEEVRSDVTALVDEVRGVVDGLRPGLLDELGLIGSVRVMAEGLGRRCSVDVRVICDPAPDLALPAAVEVAAYRIVGEALTNLARHADASTATVTLRIDAGWLVVEVTDDGRGGAAARDGGTGLGSMRHRADEVGGSLTVTSDADGTCVRASLPLAVGS
jgi:signal transduction histidine kinase